MFLEGKFHEFGTNQSTNSFIDHPQDLDICVDVPHNSTEENEHDEPNDQVEPVEQDVADIDERVNNQPVGASYEENFMREVEQLGRERRRPARFDEECHVASNLTANINEPVSIDEAFSGEHSVDWKKAAKSECYSLMEKNTWDLVLPPEGKNIVGNRWVFKVKRHAEGSVQRYKARLVTKGYSPKVSITKKFIRQ